MTTEKHLLRWQEDMNRPGLYRIWLYNEETGKVEFSEAWCDEERDE